MNPRSVPLAAMAALCAIWGYSWIAMKIALRHAHPFDFAAERLVLGTILLFAIIAVTGRRLTLDGGPSGAGSSPYTFSPSWAISGFWVSS